ncbi:hypothetical protein IV203_027058 [Nitzschia inconspicua]|uniref:Uncharacterized protein n=1 Tax=Nitzschia inconspicua TaxID=303405 RepID=A0A9K3LKE9_9STRA|nr:hypothetical protein IV203_027058 [Nitzschia inconspicua]
MSSSNDSDEKGSVVSGTTMSAMTSTTTSIANSPNKNQNTSTSPTKTTAHDLLLSSSSSSSSSTDDGDNSTSSQITPRVVVGTAMEKGVAVINEHLVAARMVVASSVILLTAYGLFHTPLFFRFRTVADIPRHYFVGRKRLYGRILKVEQLPVSLPSSSSSSSSSTVISKSSPPMMIQILVRHLSPVGMLLPSHWLDLFLRLSPSSNSTIKSKKLADTDKDDDDKDKDLLRIQIAGITCPPPATISSSTVSSTASSTSPHVFLEQLAKQRTLVSCQLLGRQVVQQQQQPNLTTYDNNNSNSNGPGSSTTIDTVAQTLDPINYNAQQVAICKVQHRTSWWRQFFATEDLAQILVKDGRANVDSSLLPMPLTTTTTSNNSNTTTTTTAINARKRNSIVAVVDTSHRLPDLRHDVKYLDTLAQTEVRAAQTKVGMWKNSQQLMTQLKPDVMEEADFQTNATKWQKLWRWWTTRRR